MKKPTDDDILLALYYEPWVLVGEACRSPDATYVIKNRLRMRGFKNVETPAVLRQLKKLEKTGKVERVATSYITMISWRLTPQASAAIRQARARA